jgi:flagellar basal body P-ring protein FlgI
VLEGTVGEWAGILREKTARLSGLGVVTGLGGTGDKGPAYQKALQVLVQSGGRPPTVPREGTIALCMVEALGESGRVKPLTAGVRLDGGGLGMTTLRDRAGEVHAAAVGTLGKGEKGVWTVKVIRKGVGKNTVILQPRFPWPELARALSERIASAPGGYRPRVEDGRVLVRCPGETPAGKLLELVGPLKFYMTAEKPKIVLDRRAGRIRVLGKGVRFSRLNMRIGDGLRVVSGGRANDFAVVEVSKKRGLVRVRTSRQVADVLRVLDRFGVTWGGIRQLLEWAESSQALPAGVFSLGDGSG